MAQHSYFWSICPLNNNKNDINVEPQVCNL